MRWTRRKVLGAAALGGAASFAPRLAFAQPPGEGVAGSEGATSWIRNAVGAFARSVGDIFDDRISVMDFIPFATRVQIRLRTSTADLRPYVLAALAHMGTLRGGGELFFPRGTYHIGGSLPVPRHTRIKGAGMAGTSIVFTHAGTDVPSGSGFCSLEKINSSTTVYISVADVGLINNNAGNLGALYYDRCGTLLNFTNVAFSGGKYGAVLDQSELVDFDLCEFGNQLFAGLWLVHGADVTPGAQPGFTNRISVKRSQFNRSSVGTSYAILDDGGYVHAFEDNNYNGYTTHIRLGVTNGVAIRGGEFEACSGHNISLQLTTLSGSNSGGNTMVTIRDAVIIASAGNRCVNIVQCGTLVLSGNIFSSNVVPLLGCGNVTFFHDFGSRAINGPGQMKNGRGVVDFTAGAFIELDATYNPPSLARGATSPIQTMTINNGVALGDFVQASFSNDLAGAVLQAWVSAAGVVSYFVHNLAGANPLHLGSGTVSIRVYRKTF